MQKDPRINQLAHRILKDSIKLCKGEKIYLEFEGVQTLPLMEEMIKETIALGGVPFYFFNDTSHHTALVHGAEAEQVLAFGRLHAEIMEKMDAYVVVRGYQNPYDGSVMTKEEQSVYNRCFMGPVHYDVRMKKRWCVLRYPTNAAASLAKMSTSAFEDFYFKACLMDYNALGEAAKPLAELMNRTDKVRIIAPGTDLSFSIKGIPATICCGQRNLPDGEVFASPVKNSVNGSITFNTETQINGNVFSQIALRVEEGKVINAQAGGGSTDKLLSTIYTDAGSCYFGEFAFGLNPFVTREICENLFDEKIAGSIHLALGNSIASSDNGNRSAIHWDLVQIQKREQGGGEIWFDDVLIRKDGKFIPAELAPLNW